MRDLRASARCARAGLATARRACAGFTLVELMVSVSLLTLVGANIYMVLADSSKVYRSQSANNETEVKVRRTLDRIALAIMGASRETLYTTSVAPASASVLNFESNKGMVNGEEVWSDPQQIALRNEDTRQVAWYENPGAVEERKIVWAKYISEFSKGEIPNGLDDNGNGLVDEQGLSFDLNGNSVTIRLTMQRPAPDGTLVTKELFTTVTCRN